jgi:hypothetical protein
MVPVNNSFQEHFERIETNLKYLIDLDLSEDEIYKDPLALALYYYYVEKNGIQNINMAVLVSWARTYCYEKLAEQKFSKKKDTEATAAILTYSTLKKDKGYPTKKKEEIEKGIKELLKSEKGKDGLFFGRPNFTAIILYATKQAGIQIEAEEEVLQSLLERYGDRKTFNNLLGLPFLTKLLINGKESAQLKEIVARAQDRLKDHLLEYDDRLYLVDSIWAFHSHDNSLLDIKGLADSTIRETPIMVSDIINKGDISDITVRQDNLKISRLYKAVFLDLITEYKKHASGLKEKDLDKRYSGEFSLKWGAFATFSIIPFVITLIVGFALRNRLKAGVSFWILQQTGTTWQALALNTFLLVLMLYLVTLSIMGVYSLYTSIVGKKLIKDLRVWQNYKHHQKKALKWFCISLLGALVLGIGTQLLENAFQNFISRKG